MPRNALRVKPNNKRRSPCSYELEVASSSAARDANGSRAAEIEHSGFSCIGGKPCFTSAHSQDVSFSTGYLQVTPGTMKAGVSAICGTHHVARNNTACSCCSIDSMDSLGLGESIPSISSEAERLVRGFHVLIVGRPTLDGANSEVVSRHQACIPAVGPLAWRLSFVHLQ